MTLFALVHGAWHGAWCWDKLVSELRARGHRTAALDLPIESGSSDTYIDPIVSMVDDARQSDDVVLVGHSMAGLVIPYVAQRTAVSHLVYVCALLPMPGGTNTELFQQETDMVNPDVFRELIDLGNDVRAFKTDEAIHWFFHDCAPEDATWAAAHLWPQYQGPGNDPPPIDISTMPSTCVVCALDRVVRPDWQRRRARDWLGVEPVELDASHSPFLSRPSELADVLVSLV